TIANDQHRSRTDLLATEYAGVSSEALETAHERASGVRERDTKLRAAYTSVLEMVRRRDAARRAAEELRACATEARRHAAMATTSAKALTDLARDLATADNDVAAKTKAAQEGSAGAPKAHATFEKEVERSGSVRDLTAARSHAALLTKAREEAELLATVASQAEASLPALHRDVTSAETAQREAETRLREEK